MTYLNTNEYTSSSISGLMNDQKNPRTDPRYRAFSSRATRLWISPRSRNKLARLRSIDLEDHRGDVIRSSGRVRGVDQPPADVFERTHLIGEDFRDLLVGYYTEQAVRAQQVPFAGLRPDLHHVDLWIVATGEGAGDDVAPRVLTRCRGRHGAGPHLLLDRSEERRVGKEWRS